MTSVRVVAIDTAVAESARGTLRAQEYVADGAADAALERLLDRPEIDYVHVRDTAAGCYDLRVERAEG
jgi:Protein of unknown function (DUF1203)